MDAFRHRERPQGERDQSLPIGEPGEREHVARGNGEGNRRKADDGSVPKEGPEEPMRRKDGGEPPEERMEVERKRPFPEEVVIGPEEQARQRPEEPNAKLGIGPPGEHAALGQHGAVGVTDEIVKIPGRSWHRVAPRDHCRLEVVVEKEGAGERRAKKDRPDQRDTDNDRSGPVRSRPVSRETAGPVPKGPPYKKVGACRYFALERLNVA
jgi:hypothetical protein